MSSINLGSSIGGEWLLAEGKLDGYLLVTKFGNNVDVDAAEDIWDGGGDYTGFPTSTLETVDVFSSSANDTAAGTGARTVRIYGLDGSYNLQEETISLNGITAVTSVNTYRRVYMVAALTAGSGTTNAGTITTRHTTTTANIFSIMPVGVSQAQTTAFTIPAGYTGYLVHLRASVLDNTANRVKLCLKLREYEGSVRLTRPFVVATDSDTFIEVHGGIKLLEKTDFVIRALTVVNVNADVTASWELVLSKN